MRPVFLRPVLPALICLLLAGCVRVPPPLTGTLQGEIRWKGTVKLSGDVILAEGSRLTIAPGTLVLFLPADPAMDRLVDHPHFPGSELIVRGTVRAEGLPGTPITFRHIDRSAPAASWGGINLQQSPEATFRYCRFTQADSALHSQESKVTVRESLFEGNLVALRFHSSEVLFENNLVRRNGTGIRFHFGSPVIRLNEIRENDKGIFVTSHPRDFRIEMNNIAANRDFSVVLGEEVPEAVPMPGNWWGSRDPQAIAASIYDRRRADYLGEVKIAPASDRPVQGAGISWEP